jgi:hypothetical protein
MFYVRSLILAGAAALAICFASPVATAAGSEPAGLVYRYYPTAGYRLNPLLSFANLNRDVSAGDRSSARRLAHQLLVRGGSGGGELIWKYDFSFDGGPAPWTSGFTQAVAAQALARAGALLHDRTLTRAAAASFRPLLDGGLVLHVGGGAWIREYGFTHQVILNAQLQTILSLESYAQVAQSMPAAALARELEQTTRRLLPRFDLGCWARYQLGGSAADAHYQAYHVELLRQLVATHHERIWLDTYRRWRRCSA